MIPPLFANMPVISAPVWSLDLQHLTDTDTFTLWLCLCFRTWPGLFFCLQIHSLYPSLCTSRAFLFVLSLFMACSWFFLLVCIQIENKVLHLYTTLQLLLPSSTLAILIESGMELPDGITRRAIGSPLKLPMLRLDGLEGRDWKTQCFP